MHTLACSNKSQIRNPLNVVMHCADSIAHSLSEVKLLLDRHDSGSMSDLESASAADNCRSLNDNMVDAVETITSCTVHQTRIIDDILSLSKLDSDLLEICPTIFQVKSFLRSPGLMVSALSKSQCVPGGMMNRRPRESKYLREHAW